MIKLWRGEVRYSKPLKRVIGVNRNILIKIHLSFFYYVDQGKMLFEMTIISFVCCGLFIGLVSKFT